MKYTPKLLNTNHNVSSTSMVRELMVLLGGLLAIIVLLYVVLGVCVELIVPRISVATEQKLASFFLASSTGDKEAGKVQQYLQKLVDTMVEQQCVALPYPLTVHYLDDEDIVNAMALPGGHILVYKGLLDIMHSENELSFVLGHEIGHFQNRDHLRGLGRGLVFAALSTFIVPADTAIHSFVGKILQTTEFGFSREQESKADESGLETLHCVYGHVTGATDFFKHMPAETDPGKLGHYFSSHPEKMRRIRHIEDMAHSKHYDSGPSPSLTPLALPKG